ncbi:UNVERIFIED_CONTAM: hypothetical protein GTU68_037370 [Idotea baltica]|nr:hypothetical protein [Idotea baltica]
MMNQAHRAIMAASGGKLGWTTAGMPVLELTTTGRKSGQQRTSMLTTPWQDGETMALVASAGGNDKHPAWFLNLRENPEVEIRTSDGTRPMIARVLAGAERNEVFEQVCAKYNNYADYQSKTDREIPVVLLEPAAE